MPPGQGRQRLKRPGVAKKFDSQPNSDKRKLREHPPGLAESNARQVRNVPNRPGMRGGPAANHGLLALFKALQIQLEENLCLGRTEPGGGQGPPRAAGLLASFTGRVRSQRPLAATKPAPTRLFDVQHRVQHPAGAQNLLH